MRLDEETIDEIERARAIACDGARKVFDKRFYADNPTVDAFGIATTNAITAAIDYAIREYHSALKAEADEQSDRWCESSGFGAKNGEPNRAGYAGEWLRALSSPKE